jgi:bifunctional DNA-binding transcriptional regulator/antitoxin component of YhaV-PrlF toxin-antitoxin module
MTQHWTVTIDNDGILPLPADLLKEAGWKEGDCLHWIDNYDGSWTLVKEELTTFINNGIINDEQN